MEDKIGNSRNDEDHYRNPWNFCIDPNSNSYLPAFEQPNSSSSSSSPFTFFNHFNNHHHYHHHHHHVDTLHQDPTFLLMEAKASQSFHLPQAGFCPSVDFPVSGQYSDSLTLKLGKRQYVEEASGSDPGFASDVSLQKNHLADWSVLKRGRPAFISFPNDCLPPSPSFPTFLSLPSVVAGTQVPRCQVEGCNEALVGAKEYHRRHKVCEMHSKAPKVIVQGVEQRFCQQCSRFHVVSKFDEAKRSCRRRLAGHNERRRKNTSDSTPRNQVQDNRISGGTVASEYSSPSTGRALSLLSAESCSPSSWASLSDLSSLSSAALCELIAVNRAASLASRLAACSASDPAVLRVSNDELVTSASHSHYHQQQLMMAQQTLPAHPSLPSLHSSYLNAPGSDMRPVVTTLDLIPAPHVPGSSTSVFRLATSRGEKHDDEVESEIWRSIERL